MTDLTQLQRQLAETYEKLELVSAAIKEAEAAFKLEMSPLYAKQTEVKTAAEALRSDISRIILEQFREDGTRPDYPLGIQVRSTAVILEPNLLVNWFVHENMPEYLKLDEAKVKNYLKENRRIVNIGGELLAGMTDEPVLVAGEKTLISWLKEEQFNAETTSTDETEIR